MESSADALCDIPKPAISEELAAATPSEVLIELDLYFERVSEGCR